MNKSTPISQLPNNPAQAQTFVNDQQRQYITQAQQALGNSPIPQNTQLSPDVMNDDDVVVQDILNQIHSSSGSGDGQNSSNENQYNQQLMMQQLLLQQQQQQQQQQLQQQLQQQQQVFLPQLDIQTQPHDYKFYLALFNNDLELAVAIFVIVIIVHFIPADKLIGKYFAIEKIPYHEIILRAIMVTLFVIIVKKFIKN